MRWFLLLLLPGCVVSATPMRPRPEAAPDLLAEADAHRRRGDLVGALARYRSVVRADPGSVRGHAGLQSVRIDQGFPLDVRRQYTAGGGYLLGRLEADRAAQAEAYRSAAEPYRSLGQKQLDRAVQLDPGLSWSRVARGRAYFLDDELGLAESEFLAALWAEPAHPVAAHGLGLVASRRGDFAASLGWAGRAFRNGMAEEMFQQRFARLAARSSSEQLRRQAAAMFAKGPPSAQIYAAKLSPDHVATARAAGADDAEIAALRGADAPAPVAKFVTALVAGVDARYRHYASTSEAEDFEEYLAWVRDLYARTTGRKLGPKAKVEQFAFVGRLVDPSLAAKEPVVLALARHGLLLALGQRSGGPPETVLAQIDRREPMRSVRIRGMTVEREVVWVRRRFVSGYVEWAGGGDVAGVALTRLVLIDVDAIARWEGGIRRRNAALSGQRSAILAQAPLKGPDPLAVDDPAGVAARLRLLDAVDLRGEISIHEDAHLVDAALHLPVQDHLLRNLGLALRSGFSGARVMAYLERNAQLTAMAEGPGPRSALATCCAALGGHGPHATGYREIVEELVQMIARKPEAYPEVDTDRVIVQQLHRLPEKKIRALAARLLRQWGLWHG